MGQETLVSILIVFVGLVAVGQLAQAVALLMIQRRAKALQDQLAAFTPRVESMLLNAQLTLEQSRKQITEVTSKANDVLDTTRLQIGKVEDLLTDVTARAKVQMDRAELVLDDTLGRVQETVVLLHSGVMKPLREINGVSAGIRAAINHVLKGRRPSVAQATHDEEMFI